ncbi:MAG: hypothetical protein J6Y80_00275 [Victivallales bacterium]|nr:hypothetical protein [Victivallales bacterium]
MNQLIEQLRQEPELTVRLEVLPGTNPKVVLNGRKYDALLYGAPYLWKYDEANTQAKIRNFHEGGIDLLFLGIEAKCWRPDGSINEEHIESVLCRALQLNPDAYLMLAINLNGAPRWWMDAHPEELMDYAHGGVDPQATDPINNVRAPSYASLEWRQDATDYLRKVVSFVESIPAGKRVFSYRVDYGIYREWHYYGMKYGLPGTCRPMRDAFRRYLAGKYRTDAMLQAAWNDASATLAGAEIPSAEARLDSIVGGNTLRDPVRNRAVVDFLHAMQAEMRDLVIACDTAVKEACGYRKLCGNYHGYVFGMEYPVEAWHLENEAVLASGVVDWQSSPNLYSFREVDDAEYGRAAVESYTLRGKLNIQEHDSRTYLAVEETYHRHVTTPAQSVTTLSRDLAQSLCRNAGCWFMDFTRDWYNDPEIFAFFRKVSGIRALAVHNAPVSEVAFVVDLESIYYHKISTTGVDLVFDCNAQELTHTATPFDVLLLSDLENPQVRDYRVYIFPDLFYLTPEKAAIIEKLRAAGKNLVWLYAAGYLNHDGHGAENIRDLTGFAVRESPDACSGVAYLHGEERMVPASGNQFAPSFAILESPGVQALATRAANGPEVTFAVRENGSAKEFYSTTGFLSRQAWKEIFARCGVHCYEPSGTTVVWASKSFLSVNGRPGKYTLRLPEPRRVMTLLPERGVLSEPVTSIEAELTEEIGLRMYYME